MPLSPNEIRSRAIAFAREWEAESSEDAEAKSFWDGFFHVFGISRRRVAAFEKPVKKSDGKGGYIDLLWKGTLLVEQWTQPMGAPACFGGGACCVSVYAVREANQPVPTEFKPKRRKRLP